jgi:hypothetical protein
MPLSPPGRHRRPKKTFRAAVPVAVALPLVGATVLPTSLPSLLPSSDAGESPRASAPTEAGPTAVGWAADRVPAHVSRLADRGEPLLNADQRLATTTPSARATHRPRPSRTATPASEPTRSRTARPTRTPEPEPTRTRTATAKPSPTRTATSKPSPEPTRRTYGPSVADAKAYAKSVLSDAEWAALNQLAIHESSWDPHATNPTSGAYGIPQSLPAEKLASAGADWRDNATTQVKWMINYCDERYGGVIAAWQFWQANHWY